MSYNRKMVKNGRSFRQTKTPSNTNKSADNQIRKTSSESDALETSQEKLNIEPDASLVLTDVTRVDSKTLEPIFPNTPIMFKADVVADTTMYSELDTNFDIPIHVPKNNVVTILEGVFTHEIETRPTTFMRAIGIDASSGRIEKTYLKISTKGQSFVSNFRL